MALILPPLCFLYQYSQQWEDGVGALRSDVPGQEPPVVLGLIHEGVGRLSVRLDGRKLDGAMLVTLLPRGPYTLRPAVYCALKQSTQVWFRRVYFKCGRVAKFTCPRRPKKE